MRPPFRHARWTAALLFAALVGGCAHAEYDLVRPPDLSQHVGTKGFVTVPQDPIEYRMIAADDHLVIQVANPTDQPIQLLAEQSAVVDPGGQSHPLPVRSQTIQPRSFVKLILPPLRERVVPTGPTIGIGFGGVFGSARSYRGRYVNRYAYAPGFYDVPRYYAVYGGDESIYWDWPDGGQARLVLVFQRGGPAGPATLPAGGGTTFTHEFVFRRQKV